MVNPAPSRLQAGQEEGLRQRQFEMPTSTEEGAGFGGWNGLGTNVAFGPPAPQIGSWWRKPNPTQSGCPTTSRHSVIPRGTNSGPWSRDQSEWTFWPESFEWRRPQESDRLAKVAVKISKVRDWVERLGHALALSGN